MSWLELVATVSGALCVFLLIRRSIWAWPVGLVQVVLFVWIFWQAKLYSDMGLHVIYIALQLYGWWNWLHGGSGSQPLEVRKASSGMMVAIGLLCIAGTVSLGYVMDTRTDAALPYPDAFTTIVSLAAQWMLTQKYIQNWALWIAVDVVAIWVYFSKALYLTTGLYALFLVMATAGLITWIRHVQSAKTPIEAAVLP